MKLLIVFGTTDMGRPRDREACPQGTATGSPTAFAPNAAIWRRPGDPERLRRGGARRGRSTAGHYQKTARGLRFTGTRSACRRMPTLFLSVSLTAAGTTPKNGKELAACSDRFAEEGLDAGPRRAGPPVRQVRRLRLFHLLGRCGGSPAEGPVGRSPLEKTRIHPTGRRSTG